MRSIQQVLAQYNRPWAVTERGDFAEKTIVIETPGELSDEEKTEIIEIAAWNCGPCLVEFITPYSYWRYDCGVRVEKEKPQSP